MSGRKRIIVGEITQSNVRGRELVDRLSKELCQDEKTSTYQKKDIKNGNKFEHKK